MALEEKQETLRQSVSDLRDCVAKITPEECLNRLVDIGFAASAIDAEALYHPDADSITKQTDALVDEAEAIIKAQEQSEHLGAVLPKVVRAGAKRQSL